MPTTFPVPTNSALEPLRRQLDNGLGVTLLSQPGTRKAAISLRVAAGSHDEPREYPGLAHFLEHLVFLGGAGFTAEQRLMPFVQACGGQVNASTQARHTDFFCEVPAEQLGEALARLIDMLARPLLTPEAQLREREVVHAEYLARSQDPETLVATALTQALPAGHPCTAFLAGNRGTLAVESAGFQQALRAFHRRFYQAGQCSLVLVGPQPQAQLLDLAERYGTALPRGRQELPVPPAPLLPLRARQLRMTLAGSSPSLHLGFALELPTPLAPGALATALGYLRTWLLDESRGGLRDSLRTAELCAGMDVQVLYLHERQAVLRLGFTAVRDAERGRAEIAAALRNWLGFFAVAGERRDLVSRYGAIQQWSLSGLPALALARYWQANLDNQPTALRALGTAGLVALRAVLGQMRAPERVISLFAGPTEVAYWPSAGFALRMITETAPLPSSIRHWGWHLPQSNPLLRTDPLSVTQAVAASWRWLQAPLEREGQGALHWRLCFEEQLAPADLLDLVEIHLARVRSQGAQLGVTLQWTAEHGGLQLCALGSSALLPRLLALVLHRLSTAAGRGACSPEPRVTNGQVPIRQLLRRLPELFHVPPSGVSPLGAERLPGLLQWTRLEGQGVGLDAAGRAAVEELFTEVTELLAPAAPASVHPGLYWRNAGLGGEESALLLFCAQAASDAASEAGWRLLAQLYQGPFFQRLRSELQLGYAVFCGYRQVSGRRGILFAVQSPHASASEVLGHIEAFLARQTERLALLGDDEVAIAAAEVARQLGEQAASMPDCAERHWQQHLAGLPQEQACAVQRALLAFSGHELRRCHRSLCQAQGGWRVLASNGTPGSDRAALQQ